MYNFIGMDEAGYGPNLGPLLISATSWKTENHPKKEDLWKLLEPVLTCTPDKKETRLHVGDSKQVYSSSKGIKSLEKSVLVFLSITGHSIDCFQSLWKSLTQDQYPETEFPPWFDDVDLALPLENNLEEIHSLADQVNQCLELNHVHLKEIRSDLVLVKRFNDCIEQFGNKGITLTSISLSLLEKLWNRKDSTYIVADKHGGRNRYDEYLSNILDDEMIFRIEESTEKSIYRINQSEIRFQTKAESHLPVALASMVSKYMREVSMKLFNQFWIQHLPNLKPTKGYPQDARRYLAEIKETQSELEISEKVLWRIK